MRILLSGSDAARALGQASLSPMLEGDGSISARDVAVSPLIAYVIPISGQAVEGLFRGTPVCSASLRYIKKKKFKLCNN